MDGLRSTPTASMPEGKSGRSTPVPTPTRRTRSPASSASRSWAFARSPKRRQADQPIIYGRPECISPDVSAVRASHEGMILVDPSGARVNPAGEKDIRIDVDGDFLDRKAN